VRRERPKERPLQRIEPTARLPIRGTRTQGSWCARLGAASVEWDGLRGLRRAPIDVGVGISARSRWAGGWVVPCALRGLRPSPVRGPRGRHRGVASERQATRPRHSLAFSRVARASLPPRRRDPTSLPAALSYEASARSPGPSRRLRPEPKLRPAPTGAEAPTGRQGPASPGVRDLVAPPPTHPPRVHSRRRAPLGTPRQRLRRALGPTAPPVQPLVPPSWFRTTSTVSSARRTAGLLHPAAGPGVRRVSRDPLPRSCIRTTRALTRCRGETGSFPATLRPFEEFPPPAAVRCHHRLSAPLPSAPPRVVAPPAPRCRSAEVVRSERAPRLRGVAPRTGPLRPTPLRAPVRSFLPWACVPFVVRRSSAASRDSPWATRPAPKDRSSGRPWRGGESPRSSRGHPSHAARKRAAGVCPEGSLPGPKTGRPPWGSRR
jgi:hypothetical protein